MIIQAPSDLELGQYIKMSGRVFETDPEACFNCAAGEGLQGHGHSFRGVKQFNLNERVRIHRFLCRSCTKTFSNILPFLVPCKRYSAKVIAMAIQSYLSQPGTSYRKVAGALTSLKEARTLSHSTVWRWVKAFCQKARMKLLIKTQGLCLSAGVTPERMAAIEMRAAKRQKKHYKEADWVAGGRLVLALSMLLSGRAGALESLHRIFLKQHSPEAIFAGPHVRLLNPRSMELVIF